MADKKKKRAPWSWQKKIAAILTSAGLLAGGSVVWWATRPGEVIDVTEKAAGARYKSGVLKRARKRKNPARDLKGITLHQTGTKGVGTKAWPKMTAHYGVQKDGRVYRIHPPEVYLFASNGLNGRTLSIEVAGLFGNQDMPPAQVRGLHEAIQLAKKDAKAIGADLEFIYGHRQSTKGRPFGPKRSIWVNGAVWADKRRIVSMEPDRTFGTGRTIPAQWFIEDGETTDAAIASFGLADAIEAQGDGAEGFPIEDGRDFFGEPGENPDQ